jgi:WD40 repeat protein
MRPITSGNVQQMQQLNVLGGAQSAHPYSDAISGMTVSEGGQYVAAYTWKALHLWDTAAQRLLWHSAVECSQAAFSPDASALAVILYGRPNQVLLLDARSGETVRVLSGPQETLFGTLAFSPDGRLLAYTTIRPTPRLALFNTQNWQIIHAADLSIGSWALSFTADSQQLMVSCAQEINPYGEYARATLLMDLATMRHETLAVGDNPAAITPDGSRLIVGHQIVDRSAGQPLHRFEGSFKTPSFSADGSLFLVANHARLTWRAVRDGQAFHTLPVLFRPFIHAYALNRQATLCAITSGGLMPGARQPGDAHSGILLWGVL